MTRDNNAQGVSLSDNGQYGDHHVQSFARGLSVIRAFGPDRPELTLSEVSSQVRMTRAAARRYLLTLVDLGYVRSDGRLYSLTPRVLDLGYAYLSSLSVAEVAQPYLEELSGEVGESCSVGVLDGNYVVYVARHATTRVMAVTISVGTRLPAFVTSMGRVLLAAMPDDELDRRLDSVDFNRFTSRTVATRVQLKAELVRVRMQGWAIVDGEFKEGTRSVATLVRNAVGEAVAAVNISAPQNQSSLEDMRRRLLPALLATASRIEADLPVKS